MKEMHRVVHLLRTSPVRFTARHGTHDGDMVISVNLHRPTKENISRFVQPFAPSEEWQTEKRRLMTTKWGIVAVGKENRIGASHIVIRIKKRRSRVSKSN